jgi:hypothetical protein
MTIAETALQSVDAFVDTLVSAIRAMKQLTCCNLLQCNLCARLFIAQALDELPDVGMMLCHQVVESLVPTFQMIICPQVRIVHIPHSKRDVNQPFITEISEQWYQTLVGCCKKLLIGVPDEWQRNESQGHKLTNLLPTIDVSVVQACQTQMVRLSPNCL